MPADRPNNAREDSLERTKASELPKTAATDQKESLETALAAADEPSKEIEERVASAALQSAEGGVEQSALEDADAAEPEGMPPEAPVADDAGPPEAAAYERPPLHPMMWEIDPIAAANTSAAVQSGARRPEVQALVANSPELSTLPLLGADGGRPKDTQEMLRGLFLWETAAAEAIGDPLFTPKPTSKPRNQLTKFSRGSLFPDVWVDQHTLQPALFDREDEYDVLERRPWQRPAMPVRSTPRPQARNVFAGATPHIDQPLSAVPAGHSEAAPAAESYSPSAAPSDETGMPGFRWPRVIVELSEPEKFFEAELDAIADRQRAIARYEANEAVYEYDSWNQAQERALWGKD